MKQSPSSPPASALSPQAVLLPPVTLKQFLITQQCFSEGSASLRQNAQLWPPELRPLAPAEFLQGCTPLLEVPRWTVRRRAEAVTLLWLLACHTGTPWNLGWRSIWNLRELGRVESYHCDGSALCCENGVGSSNPQFSFWPVSHLPFFMLLVFWVIASTRGTWGSAKGQGTDAWLTRVPPSLLPTVVEWGWQARPASLKAQMPPHQGVLASWVITPSLVHHLVAGRVVRGWKANP